MLVFKTARVAHFFSSARVLAISSRINFFWYIQRITPSWYWKQLREKRERTRREKEEMEKNANFGKRDAWGGVGLAALAAVRARAKSERKKQEEEDLRFFGMIKYAKQGLRYVGWLPSTNVEINRHIAATKIQRAWRKSYAKHAEARSEDGIEPSGLDDEAAWTGRLGAQNSIGRIMNARSLLGQYHKQNYKNIKHGGRQSYFTRYSGFTTLAAQRSSQQRANSQLGSAMAEVTGQRVALITFLSLVLTILFTYQEIDASRASTMVVLHGQVIENTREMADKALWAARNSSVPLLFRYKNVSNAADSDFDMNFTLPDNQKNPNDIRPREKLNITVKDIRGGRTEALFVYRKERIEESIVELLSVIFILLIWFLGVTAFAAPVMTLVIQPIERMVRLLGMIMVDPLGYENNPRLGYKKFVLEEEEIVKKSQWTKEMLKGMETNFIMTTIRRVGELMKVGFGSAGVEIIRHNLQKGQNKNTLLLNTQGSAVACIFLFCDIRRFTDATECLQEEVFVFTNRIAAVVHSICHSYGGSANKNVGDAFLVSWKLKDQSDENARFNSTIPSWSARLHQADKALLSVVKICMALHYDDYYVETMSDSARSALLKKFQNRAGPIVQMGFGLHVGKAVQGAIGSQRKIDATYVSEAVEKAEFLEASTKRYGVKMLMSDSFHRLLHPNNRRRCRKIDQILFHGEDEGNADNAYHVGDVMELFTFDMDIDALWKSRKSGKASDGMENENEESITSSRRDRSWAKKSRRMSMRKFDKRDLISDEQRISSSSEKVPSMIAATKAAAVEVSGSTFFEVDDTKEAAAPKELILPTGPAFYNANVWLKEDMRLIRQQYTSEVFETFNLGLERYYEKDWTGARQCFESILERLDDGPSRYFSEQMKKHNWKPPHDFQEHGIA